MGNKNVCICLIRATFSLSLWFGHISCQLQSFGISTNHLENKRVSVCCHCGAEFAAQFLCLQRHYYFICRPARLYIFFLSFWVSNFAVIYLLFAHCSFSRHEPSMLSRGPTHSLLLFFSSSLDSRALVCYHLLLFQTEGCDVTCVQSACTERWRSEPLCEELITVTRLAAFHPSSLSILSSL